jgi:ATP-binding cassette subfamily B protein/subfamily B ATP-binding cassette protein MsbA
MRRDRETTLAVLGRLLPQALRGEFGRTAVGMALVIASSAALVLEPWPLKLIVDSVLGDRPLPALLADILPGLADPVGATVGSRLQLLGWLCAGVVALRLIVGVLNMSSTNVLVSVGLRMVFRLRCRLFDHVQRLSLAFHDATPVGDSLYRVTWDSYAAQTIFNSGMVPILTATATLAGILFMMTQQDPVVTLVALAVCLPLALLIRQLDRPTMAHSLRVHERESDVSARVQETLVGIRAVQAFGREEFEGARFREHARASLAANVRLTAIQTGSQALAGTLMAAGAVAVIFLAARRALEGQMTAGDVVLTAAYVTMLYRPLETLTYTAGTLQAATAGARRVLAVLDVKPDVVEASDAVEFPGRARGHVRFESVDFAYRDGHPVLRDFTLDVPAGQTVALVGASGAGKTTVASLLLRFYDPEAGCVRLDGRDVRTLTLASLRRNIALVLQEPVLFGATIGENIAYGRPGATFEEIRLAAQAAGAHDFIMALPRGYETAIGERGAMLSGGQRQRLSIARAFLKDAPILILDEPTSALDAETEAMLLETLRRLMRGRTTLIIAHRLSTVRDADHIVVLQEGRIAESGTQADLLAHGSVYARLHRLQFDREPAGSMDRT